MADANAQYVIDVATRMVGGFETNTELDKLASNLVASGAEASHFEQAIKQTAIALAAAKEASAAANSALAAGQQEYRLLEAAAAQAAKAEAKAVAAGAQGPDIGRQARLAKEAVDAYAGTLKGLEADAKAAAQQEDALGKQLTSVKSLSAHAAAAQGEHTSQLRELKKGLAGVDGPLGTLGKWFAKDQIADEHLDAALGKNGAQLLKLAGFASAAAVAFAVVAAAIATAVVATAAWGVSLADANRNAALTQQAVETMHPEFVALEPAILAAGKATGLTSDKLQGLAKQLEDAHVAAADMPKALQAIALEQRALGDAGAQDFVDKIKAGKIAVGELASQTQAKLGGIVAKEMIGLDAQAVTLKSNLAGTFGGLKIEGLLGGLQSLVSLFDKDTASGQTLKFLFEGLFQPLVDGATGAIPTIERAFLTVEIWALKAYIFMKPAIKAFQDSGVSAEALGSVLRAVAVAVAIAAAQFAIVGGSIAVLIALFGAVVGAGVEVGLFFARIPGNAITAFNAIVAYVKGIDWGALGQDIMAGFAQGILAGGAAVLHAITGVIGGAIDAAKHALDSHSPSKVFYALGTDTTAGYANAVDDTAPDAHAAVSAMVSPPALPPAAPVSAPGPAALSAGKSGMFAGAELNFYARTVDDAKAFAEEFTRLLEGDATALGGVPA